MILLDTNILIEIFKGNEIIANKLDQLDESFIISSITQMELYYGAFNKREMQLLDKFLNSFLIIQIDNEISVNAVNLIKKYSKSHNLNIPDALIASTALVKNVSLFTLNVRDFKYIENLKLITI